MNTNTELLAKALEATRKAQQAAAAAKELIDIRDRAEKARRDATLALAEANQFKDHGPHICCHGDRHYFLKVESCSWHLIPATVIS